MSKKELANKKVVKAISLGLATALTMMQPMTALADEAGAGTGSVEPAVPEIVEESGLPTVQEVVAEATKEVKEAQEAADDVVVSVKVPLINKDFDIPLEEKVEVLEKSAQKDLKDAEKIVGIGDKIIEDKEYLEDVVVDEKGNVVDVEKDSDKTAIDDKSVNDINAAEDAIDKITDGSTVIDEETGEGAAVPSVAAELTDAIDNADQLLANKEDATYGEALSVANELKDVVDKTQALVDDADAAVAKAEGTLAAAEEKYAAAKEVSETGAELAAKEVEKAKYETAVAYQNAEKLHSVLDNAKTKLDGVQAAIHEMQAKNEENIATAQNNLADAKEALTESVENLKEEAGELKESVSEFKDQVGELKDSIDNFIDKVEVAKETQDTLDGLYGEYYAAQMNYTNMLNLYNSAILKWNDWAANYENLTDDQKTQVELALGAENLDKICKGMTNLVETDENGKPVYDENGRVKLSDEVQKDAMASADNSLIYQLYSTTETAKSTLDTAEETYNNINDEKLNDAIAALAGAIEAGNEDTSSEQQALGAALIQKYLSKGATVTWVAPDSELEATYGSSEMGYYVVTAEGEEGFDVYGYTYGEDGTLNVVNINSTITDYFNGLPIVDGKVTIDGKEYTLNTDSEGNKYFIDQDGAKGVKQDVHNDEETVATVGFAHTNFLDTEMRVSKSDKEGVYEITFDKEMKETAIAVLNAQEAELDAKVAEDIANDSNIQKLASDLESKKAAYEKAQAAYEKASNLIEKGIKVAVVAAAWGAYEIAETAYNVACEAKKTPYASQYNAILFDRGELEFLSLGGDIKFTFTKDKDSGEYTKPSYKNFDLSFMLKIKDVTTTPEENYSNIIVDGSTHRLNSDANGAYYEENGSKVYVDGIKNEKDGETYYFARQNGEFVKGQQVADSVYTIGDIANSNNYKNEQDAVTSKRYATEKSDTYQAYQTATSDLETAKTTYADAVNEYTALEARFKDFDAAADELDRTDLQVKITINGNDNSFIEQLSSKILSILPESDLTKIASELNSGADLANLPKGISDLLSVDNLKLITDADKLKELGNSIKTMNDKDAGMFDKVVALKSLAEFMPATNLDINAMATAVIISNTDKNVLKAFGVTDFQINYAKSWVDALNAKVEVVKAGLDVAKETGETITAGIDVIKEGVETGEAITDTTLKSVEVALKAVALGGAKMDKGILAVADLIVDKLDGFVSDLEAKAEKAKDEAEEAKEKVAALEKMAPKSQELAVARKALDDAKNRLDSLNGELGSLQKQLEEAKKLQEEAQDLADSLYKEPVNNNNNNDNGGQGGNGGNDENQDYSDGTTGGLETVRNAVVLSDEDMALFAQAVVDQAVLGARQSRGSRVAAKAVEEVEEAAPAEKVEAPAKKVEEVVETPVEENLKQVVEIDDTKTALAGSLTEEEKAGMNWWWLLLVAVLGGTGVAIYRNNQKKKATAQTKKSDK